VDIENYMTTYIIGGGTKFGVKGQYSKEKHSRKKKVFQNIYQGIANFVPQFGGGGGKTILLTPFSAALDLNFDPAGGYYGDHTHFSSLIVLFPITYKP
jgi:hypothetical protein